MSRPNLSKFDEQCGLARGHLGIILSRLEQDPTRDIETDTLAAIAKGGGVSVEWLAQGTGQPDGVPTTSTGDTAEARRALAARIALEGGVLEAAVYSVLREPLHPEDSGRPSLWWIHIMEARETEITRAAASVGRILRRTAPSSKQEAPASSRPAPTRSGEITRTKRRAKDEAPVTPPPRAIRPRKG